MAAATRSVLGFRRHLRVEVVPGDATYLISEAGTTRLPGDDVALLAPLLDGTRALDAIVATLADRLPAVRVGQLVGQLIGSGAVRYLHATGGPASPADAAEAAEAYWDLAGVDGTQALTDLDRRRVQIARVGGPQVDAVVAALGTAGIATTGADEPAGDDVVLVLTDDYLTPELGVLDRRLAAAGRTWLLARLGGPSAWVGPWFGPAGGAACWTCLAHRVRANRLRETPRLVGAGSPDAVLGALRAPPTATAVTIAAGAHQVALALAHRLAGRSAGADEIVVHDTVATTIERHAVLRRPQCPVCGDADLVRRRTAGPIAIVSRPKTAGGAASTGTRARSSVDTYAAYAPLIGTVTGVVPEVRVDERAPDGMHVYLAGVNVADASSAAAGRRALRQICGGKGTTDVDARTGALCEALERFSGQFDGDELRRAARFADLDDALDPRSAMLFDDRQYADRSAASRAEESAFERVPEPFDPHAVLDWTPVFSLTTQRHVSVPTAMLYYDLGGRGVRGGRYVVADSNGNAAGASLEDAVVQGYLELVERDAVAIWWYNRTRRPGFDLDAFADPWLDQQRDLHASLGRELAVLDISTDLGIPVAAAVSHRTDAPTEDICLGFGAHLDPAIALRRAVAETAQLMPAVLPGGGVYGVDDPQLVSWWTEATTSAHPYLAVDPQQMSRSPQHWNYLPRADLADDVADLVALTTAHGMEVLVLDQTRPDVGLPVVKVIVPGLRHFWRRLAPGRLYDVPVALGHVELPTPYGELNQVPIFL